MKTAIVIPLKSKKASRDWMSTSQCFAATLNSLDRQASDEWVAVVVGHEKPEIEWPKYSERINWTPCDVEIPPLRVGGSYQNHKDFDYILDKRRKISQGMRCLQGHYPDYWFALDADDLVHRLFIDQIHKLPVQPGWLITDGYFWFKDLKRWRATSSLASRCGSTTVIHSSLFNVPPRNDEYFSSIPFCRLGHTQMEGFLRARSGNADLHFPLAAIAYTMSTGDNCSDEFRETYLSKFKLALKKRLFSNRVTEDFSRAFGVACDD